MNNWYQLDTVEVLQQLDTNADGGLSQAEAGLRLVQHGPNELQETHAISPWALLLEQFKNVLIIILLIATVISFFLGHSIEAIAIAIIMLFSIAGTLIFSSTIDAEPLTEAQAQGTGFSALHEEIEVLFDGQPVLIAFDYQAATAGELHTAAATVVDHLMEQGTFLTFISTQPAGPALAEHFLDATQSHHNYVHTQKYINLGYLPGESAGLVSFMLSPKKIIHFS